jgi:hypothetical protein
MIEYTCHAIHCIVKVAPKLFMCKKHWAMVPDYLQQLIYQTYRSGQEKDRRPSRVWLKYAKQAIACVTREEKKSE